jgi:hypothetical protein
LYSGHQIQQNTRASPLEGWKQPPGWSSQQSYAGTNNPFRRSVPSYDGGYNPFLSNVTPSPVQPFYPQNGAYRASPSEGLPQPSGQPSQQSYAGIHSPFLSNMTPLPVKPVYSQNDAYQAANIAKSQPMLTVDEFKRQYKLISVKDLRDFYRAGMVR